MGSLIRVNTKEGCRGGSRAGEVMYNPFGGTNRIRFTGYNLSPLPALSVRGAPLCLYGRQRYTHFLKKKLLIGVFLLFCFKSQTALVFRASL